MKELYIFLTHHFEEPFLSFITKFPSNNCVILFDCNGIKPDHASINIRIPIINMERIKTSYDSFGHSMYISFIRQNKQLLKKYDYFWIIENDVYVPFKINGNQTFMDIHQQYDYDLMVPEYGVRKPSWCWLRTLQGFKEIKPIGVTGVIMRMSSKFLKELLKIDIEFTGYMEAVLPQLCIHKGFNIQCFLPEYIGKITTDREDLLMRQIMKNPDLIEEKLYHPFKKI